MSVLATLLGLMPESRILVLGVSDLVLEAALTHQVAAAIAQSPDGRGVARASADIVVMGRGATAQEDRRHSLLAVAARALAPGGVFAAEFPHRFAALARPLLAHENVRTNPDAGGGVTYRGARRLVLAAGFTQVLGFICLPSLAAPDVILPLASRRALAFHFRPPFFPESGRRRILRQALQTTARAGLLPAIAPSFALIATRGGEPGLAEAA